MAELFHGDVELLLYRDFADKWLVDGEGSQYCSSNLVDKDGDGIRSIQHVAALVGVGEIKGNIVGCVCDIGVVYHCIGNGIEWIAVLINDGGLLQEIVIGTACSSLPSERRGVVVNVGWYRQVFIDIGYIIHVLIPHFACRGPWKSR